VLRAAADANARQQAEDYQEKAALRRLAREQVRLFSAGLSDAKATDRTITVHRKSAVTSMARGLGCVSQYGGSNKLSRDVIRAGCRRLCRNRAVTPHEPPGLLQQLRQHSCKSAGDQAPGVDGGAAHRARQDGRQAARGTAGDGRRPGGQVRDRPLLTMGPTCKQHIRRKTLWHKQCTVKHTSKMVQGRLQRYQLWCCWEACSLFKVNNGSPTFVSSHAAERLAGAQRQRRQRRRRRPCGCGLRCRRWRSGAATTPAC
jgi:hypothetical protein